MECSYWFIPAKVILPQGFMDVKRALRFAGSATPLISVGLRYKGDLDLVTDLPTQSIVPASQHAAKALDACVRKKRMRVGLQDNGSSHTSHRPTETNMVGGSCLLCIQLSLCSLPSTPS